MDFIILYIFIYVMEAYIFFRYCSQRFDNLHSKKYTVSIFALFYGILFLLSMFKSFEINTIAFTIANFCIIQLIYQLKFQTALFNSFITTCINCLCEIIVVGLSSQFNGTILYTLSDISYLSLLTILSKSFYFFCLNTINKLLPTSSMYVKNDIKQIQANKTTALLNIIPLISFYIILVLYNVLLYAGINNKFRYMLSSAAILLILINILIYYVYHYTLQKNTELTELQIQYQKEYDMADYYKKLFTQTENQQIFIHDIRKHLSSIRRLIEQHEEIKVINYLNTLLDSDELQNSISICDNEMLNSIICHYIHLCNNLKIKFKSDIHKNVLENFEYTDLTTLFCNLLDNSIEACANVSDACIELNISKKNNTSMTIISVINSCAVRPQFDKHNKPISTKSNKNRHGLGIKSIEHVISKYTGNINMYFDEETMTFHTVIMLMIP